MSPSESSILSSFLLNPAPLEAFMSLRQFTDLFPAKHRSNPFIPELYQELQEQRAGDIEQVRRNIATEVKHGDKQRRRIAKMRQRTHNSDMAGLDLAELQMEGELFGIPNGRHREPHTLQTVHPSIEHACTDIEAHVSELESEISGLLSEITEVVGGLSDLRFGRFNRSSGGGDDITEEVLSTLKRLEDACKNVGDDFSA